MSIHTELSKQAARRGNPLRFRDIEGRSVVIDMKKNPPHLWCCWTKAHGWEHFICSTGGMHEVKADTWKEARREAGG